MARGLDEEPRERCSCGAPITGHRSDIERCRDCARERSLMLARRRKMAQCVPPEHLEGALALQDAKREALEQHRRRLMAQYEAYESSRCG